MRPPSTLDWLVLIFLAAMWGASFYFIKHAVQLLDPLHMAVWRMALASVLNVPIAAAYWSKIDWRRWKPLVVVAFCGSAIPNFLFAVAQRHVNSSLAGMLNSLSPLFTLILGVSFFGMRLTRNKVIGVALGLAGALTLILFNAKSAVSGNAFFAGLCALATVCYAINANVVHTWLRDQPAAGVASAAFMITGGLFLLGLWATGAWTATWQNPAAWTALGYVFYLAAIGTVLGNIIYFWLLQRTSAIFATSVTYLLPVTAIAIGIFDGETVGPIELLGIAVILVGLYVARK